MLCIIYWIEIYSVDNVIHPLNNCGRRVTLYFTGQAQRERKGQRAKKVVSDSPGLVDFAIGLVIFVLNLPDRQVLCFWEIQITEGW